MTAYMLSLTNDYLALAGNASAIVTNNIKDFQNTNLSFPTLLILKPEQLIRS